MVTGLVIVPLPISVAPDDTVRVPGLVRVPSTAKVPAAIPVAPP